jgi:hypothetical protein
MGLLGNLSAAQVVEQVVEARRWLGAQQQQGEDLHLPALNQLEPSVAGGSSSSNRSSSSSEGGSFATGTTTTASSSTSSSGSSSKRSKKGKVYAPVPAKINNIVFMGMGEPLQNMPAVMPALDILCSPSGLSFGRSKVIVSTVRVRWHCHFVSPL